MLVGPGLYIICVYTYLRVNRISTDYTGILMYLGIYEI